MEEGIEIFCSYAPEDKPLQQELEKQLAPLKHEGLVHLWHSYNISAGEDREQEINKHLNSAQIILLLISADFMASKYYEVRRAITRHNKGEARVIPVILRPVDWQNAPFGKLQALPAGAIPVTSSQWYHQDEAFYSIARGIRTVVEELKANAQITSQHDLSTTFVLPKKNGTQQKTTREWLQESYRLIRKGHYREALSACEQALHLDPQSVLAQANLSYTLHKLGRHEEALSASQQALSLDQNNARIHANMGKILIDLKRYQAALVACNKAISLESTNATPYISKAYALLKLGHYEEAIIACDQALQLDPKNAIARTNRDAAYKKIQQFKNKI